MNFYKGEEGGGGGISPCFTNAKVKLRFVPNTHIIRS